MTLDCKKIYTPRDNAIFIAYGPYRNFWPILGRYVKIIDTYGLFLRFLVILSTIIIGEEIPTQNAIF